MTLAIQLFRKDGQNAIFSSRPNMPQGTNVYSLDPIFRGAYRSPVDVRSSAEPMFAQTLCKRANPSTLPYVDLALLLA